MRVGSVCSGIGGLELGLEGIDHEIAWFAETDPFASRILAKRWPGIPNVGDWTDPANTTTDWAMAPWELDIDVLVGGIPCQGHSLAGTRKGESDERNLWPDFRELCVELQPKMFLIENVRGLLSSNEGGFFHDLITDAAEIGYTVEWTTLGACHVGAPHQRLRLFIVGHRGEPKWTQADEEPCLPGCMPGKMPNAGMYDGTTLTTRKMEPIHFHLDIAVHEEIGPPNRLNPDWTEALMGLPLGWTDPDCDICRPFTDWPMGRWPTPRRLDGSVKGDQFHGDWGEDLKSRLEQYGSDVMLNSAVRMVGGPQHDWEPPRITDPKMPNRIERLAVIGNAVSPQVAARIWRSIT